MTFLKSITVISLISVTVFLACGKNAVRIYTPLGGPDWYNSDITKLAIADNPEELSKLADFLSQRNASKGQKDYALRLAQLAYEKSDSKQDVTLTLLRTAYIACDVETDDDRAYKLAKLGIESICPEKGNCVIDDPVANYYYAVHMGIIVKEKGLFGIGKLPLIEKALKASLAKPETDMGGPYRVLGMLYLKAPAWPKGIGDLDKSLEMLEIASREYPAFPQNHMFYALALMDDEDYEAALEEIKKAQSMNVQELWGEYYYHAWKKESDIIYAKIQKKLKKK